MDEFIKLGYLAGATRFRRISDKLYIDGNKLYGDANAQFKVSWFPVYYALSVSEKPLTVSDLARIIGFSHITVKNVVREMENGKLVQIGQNIHDRRSKLIHLSPKGISELPKLKELWKKFSIALQNILEEGHPDILNILTRIDGKLDRCRLYDTKENDLQINILDYKPSLKDSFTALAGDWLSDMLNGKLEPEDSFTVYNPGEACLLNGGFVFLRNTAKK